MLYSLSLFNEQQEGFFIGLFVSQEKAGIQLNTTYPLLPDFGIILAPIRTGDTFGWAAFAQRDASGGFILTSQPKWLQLPEGPERFLSLAELNRDWHGLCGELNAEELEQIRYWKPQTVAEIIFNTWD